MATFNKALSRKERESLKQKFDTGRIYMAEVMDVRNTSRSGELLVYIVGSDLDKNDSRNWMVASYASNFYGTTPYDANSSKDYAQDPKSFGSWFPMPCVGNYVFIFFPVSLGENTNAYWFACPINPNANYMLPGIPGKYTNDKTVIEDDEIANDKKYLEEKKSSETNTVISKGMDFLNSLSKNKSKKSSKKDEEHQPLCERNVKTYTVVENKDLNHNILESQKKQAVYEPLEKALIRQGLNKDGIRGYSTAGSKRESPSMCYGILTPMGNSLVIDDGWSNSDNTTTWTYHINDEDKLADEDINQKRKLVGSDGKGPWQRTYEEEQKDEFKRHNAGFRFRTRNGSQVLITDEGTIYAINSNGTAWIELSKDGNIECYSDKGITMSSEGDINLHTYGNILMEAGQNIAFKSNGNINLESVRDINIAKTKHINTEASISATEILAENGNISTLQSNEAQISGTFSGTLNGTAYYATYSGLIPIPQPEVLIASPQLLKPREQQKHTIKAQEELEFPDVINTKITTPEPYLLHDKDAEINDVIEDEEDNISTPLPTVNNNAEGCRRSIGENISNIANEGATNQVCKNPAVIDTTPVGSEIPDIQLSQHFTLKQLCHSDTAISNNVKNIPTQQAIDNLKLLAQNVLEPIWDIANKNNSSVKINSGYRNAQVNVLVKGAKGSQHMTGQAADIEIPGYSNWNLAQFVKNNLDYDQLILENCTNLSNDPNSGWVHVSYNGFKNRKEEYTYRNYQYKPGLYR